MNRRTAIQQIAMASVSTIFLTGCADQNVVEFLVDGRLNLNQKHRDYLGKISEAILPVQHVSDKIPPPIDLMMAMMNDCTDDKDRLDFATGFEQYKLLMQEASTKLKRATPAEIIDSMRSTLASEAPSKELVKFINTVRSLSIKNLKQSEYYLTEYMEYKLIPDTHQPCAEA